MEEIVRETEHIVIGSQFPQSIQKRVTKYFEQWYFKHKVRYAPTWEINTFLKILDKPGDRTTVKPLGKCSLKLRNPATQKKYRAEFVVVQGPAMSILGARTVQQMGLVDVHFERIHLMTKIPAQPPRNLIEEYKDVFDKESGTIGSKLHLQTDTRV